ncbi:MAG: hypothetical protein V4496_05535, partial [Pseudomonadota bacterium]
ADGNYTCAITEFNGDPSYANCISYVETTVEYMNAHAPSAAAGGFSANYLWGYYLSEGSGDSLDINKNGSPETDPQIVEMQEYKDLIPGGLAGAPTAAPVTMSPSVSPTLSVAPTVAPTFKPTQQPTTAAPSVAPTFKPTAAPTTMAPSVVPTSAVPTIYPTVNPTFSPTNATNSDSHHHNAGAAFATSPVGLGVIAMATGVGLGLVAFVAACYAYRKDSRKIFGAPNCFYRSHEPLIDQDVKLKNNWR